MRFVIIFMLVLFILASCGKKSNPEYQALKSNLINII